MARVRARGPGVTRLLGWDRSDERSKGPRPSKRESAAYQAYKSSLDAVFDGGDVPDSLKEKLEAAGIGQDKKARKAAAKRITDAGKPADKLGH